MAFIMAFSYIYIVYFDRLHGSLPSPAPTLTVRFSTSPFCFPVAEPHFNSTSSSFAEDINKDLVI